MAYGPAVGLVLADQLVDVPALGRAAACAARVR